MDYNSKKMIPFEEALELIMATAQPGATLKVGLQDCLHRVLAENIHADRDMPPFNKSAMDGFACRKEDLDHELRIIDEIPAGSLPNKIIGPNQCARIMTGAMVPEGADFVLMKEFVQYTGPETIRCTQITPSANICYKAEDLRQGDLIAKRGTVIKAQHVALLASVGMDCPLVFDHPAVAVISTGSELVEPAEKPQEQQIRNSNSFQLLAQLNNIGLTAGYQGIVKDDAEEIHRSLTKAINEYDVILVSGGVSVGDYDYIPEVLQRMGAKVILHGLNVKPGKHLLFARLGDKFVIGLPGNPVSSFVQFELLVKPFLMELMGCHLRTMFLKLPLSADYSRRKADNLLFLPVSIGLDGTVSPIEYHGSAHIHAYTDADGILEIPVGLKKIEKGELVHVRPL
jgi:molybdopterin molybdotransferase